MSVEIKLAFDTAEEAIVALGKLVGIKGRKNAGAGGTSSSASADSTGGTVGGAQVNATPTATPAAVQTDAAPAPRRPGRPRKATSEQGAAVVPPVSQAPAQPAALPPAAPPTPEPAAPAAAIATPPTPAPAAAVPTEEDVQKAVEKIFTAKDYDGTLALLQRFGVKRGKDLPADQRANFINRVAGVLERGEVI